MRSHLAAMIIDDFQSVLRSLSTLMLVSIVTSHSMECESMLFLTNHIPYVWGFSNSFSNSFIDFTATKLFHQVIWERTNMKLWPLRIHNGCCFETLNLLHVSSSEMFTFCDVFHEENKKHKQTLESAQYGLEIMFNFDWNMFRFVATPELKRAKKNNWITLHQEHMWFWLKLLIIQCNSIGIKQFGSFELKLKRYLTLHELHQKKECDWFTLHEPHGIPYYRKLTLHEINANR